MWILRTRKSGNHWSSNQKRICDVSKLKPWLTEVQHWLSAAASATLTAVIIKSQMSCFLDIVYNSDNDDQKTVSTDDVQEVTITHQLQKKKSMLLKLTFSDSQKSAPLYKVWHINQHIVNKLLHLAMHLNGILMEYIHHKHTNIQLKQRKQDVSYLR